ncbi:MAG: SufE family protein [Bdellovibrionales bacterium]|nr:SufE family protein [Bdellovibrionales bacterium]
MTQIKQRQQKLVEEFSKLQNWEERYKKVIEIGKALPQLPSDYYDEKFLVKGCQSQVWLHAQLDEKGQVKLFADSDAMIVKGLVAILLKVYSEAEPDDILSSPPTFIEELGFRSHLSPSRANGLMSMVKQIMLYAAAFKAMKS